MAVPRNVLRLFALFLLLQGPLARPEPSDSTARPNVIVILADDLGYGDVGCYGAETVDTPHIDRLAAEGTRFISGYASAATCTPTRFSFLTGMHAFRQPGTHIAPPNATALIQPGTVTLPSLLKEAGYTTAVIGKWHLGLGAPPLPDWNGDLKPGPLEIGFDYAFLLPTTNDRVPPVYVENHRVLNLDPEDPLWVDDQNRDGQPTGVDLRAELKMNWSNGHNQSVHNGIGRIGFFGGGKAARWRDEDLADEWVKRSIAWIEQNRERPFFLFFSSHDIHVPRMPHERFQGATDMGCRGDAIVQLDWSVGQLLDALDRLGLDKNTLVIFCSDNGPVLNDGYFDGSVAQIGQHKPAGPFRGGKYSPYEGGTRTPFIARWPGTVPVGSSDALISTLDLPATLAALAGQPVPEGALPDSVNLMNTLLGRPGAEGRDNLIQEASGGRYGFRRGDWKLIIRGDTPLELYDLSDEPGEHVNRLETDPQTAEELMRLYRSIRAR